ncbi:MAG: endolytic transglycosylase MltG, partial [Erysipelotrichaceae bacterium]
SSAISKEALIKIIPGDWAKEVALQIEEKTAYTQAEVLALWNDPTYITTLSQEYSVITPEIIKTGVNVLLEGYLMPDTYFINPESSLETITEKFISELQAFYEENKTLFDGSQFSIHELITLASIVQFEASGLTDMKMVAQVFLNRLALPMRLQSSVTICYSLYVYDTWRDCETNSDIKSPYNTYLHDGLPIGPIDNPSKNAILATLNPTKNDYYYFIADVYGDGTIYYARTYAQHLANVKKYLK